MKMITVILLSFTLTLTGCVTPRTISPGVEPASIREKLHAGDRVRLVLKSGETRNLKIVSLDDQSITGTEGQGDSAKSVQIAIADVQSVEYRRLSAGRTTGLVLGVIVGLAATLLAAVLIECRNDRCFGE